MLQCVAVGLESQPPYNTLQHITTHCNTLPHTATRCNIQALKHSTERSQTLSLHAHIKCFSACMLQRVAVCYRVLQCVVRSQTLSLHANTLPTCVSQVSVTHSRDSTHSSHDFTLCGSLRRVFEMSESSLCHLFT